MKSSWRFLDTRKPNNRIKDARKKRTGAPDNQTTRKRVPRGFKGAWHTADGEKAMWSGCPRHPAESVTYGSEGGIGAQAP